MIERRPHWDDELISAVTHQVQGFGYVPLDQVVANVIAAVEDWHERKGEDNLPLLMAMQNAEITKFLHRAEQAEAAIARVREIELVFPPDNAPPWVHGEARGWNKALGEVRRALECDEDGAT